MIKRPNDKVRFDIKKDSKGISLDLAANFIFDQIINRVNFACEQYEVMNLIPKLGMDGGQSKQKINFMKDDYMDDSNILIISSVPMLLVRNQKLLDQNSYPSSVLSFIPLENIFLRIKIILEPENLIFKV